MLRIRGGTVVTRPKILTYYSVIEYDKTPHVKFRFYYRPRGRCSWLDPNLNGTKLCSELLLARGIIQMPSAAKPVESKIPEIDNPKAVKREHESDDEEVQEIEVASLLFSSTSTNKFLAAATYESADRAGKGKAGRCAGHS